MPEDANNYGVWLRWALGILIGGGGIIGILKYCDEQNRHKWEFENEQQKYQQEQSEQAMGKYNQDLAEWENFSPSSISQYVLTLRGDDALDVEHGTVSSNPDQSKSWDLEFVCGAEGYEALRALDGCSWYEAGVQDFNAISYKTILNSSYSSKINPVTGYPDLFYAHKSNVPGEGYTFFIKTSDGNIGKIQIQGYQTIEDNPYVCRNLKLQYQLFPVVSVPPKPQPPI